MPQQKEVPVKSKSKVVGTASYYVFDTVQDAVETLGEENTLGLINSQHRTNAMNEVRQAAVQKPSKALIRKRAMALIQPQEWIDCGGDGEKIERMVEAKMAEVEQEMLAEARNDEEDDSEE